MYLHFFRGAHLPPVPAGTDPASEGLSLPPTAAEPRALPTYARRVEERTDPPAHGQKPPKKPKPPAKPSDKPTYTAEKTETPAGHTPGRNFDRFFFRPLP